MIHQLAFQFATEFLTTRAQTPRRDRLRSRVRVVVDSAQLAFPFFRAAKIRDQRLTNEQIQKIKKRLARGRSLRTISAELGIDHNRLWREVTRLGLDRRRRLTASEREQARQMINDDVPQATIAKLMGRNRSTINRLAMGQRRNTEGIQFAGARNRHCPRHGPVNVWPCVTCSAEAYRKQHGRSR